MSSKQCAQCGLVNWASAEQCKRCGFSFEAQERPEQNEGWTPNDAWSEGHECLKPEPTHIFSGGVKFLMGVFAVEAVAIVLSLVHVLEGDPARAVSALFIFGGMGLLILTHIWLVVRIFEQSVWWGVGTLFVPLVGIVAVIQFWQKTKRSFVGQLICMGIFFSAILIMPL